MGSCPKGYIQLPEYIDIHFTPLYIGGEVRISYSGRVDTPLAGNPKNQNKGTQKSQKAQKRATTIGSRSATDSPDSTDYLLDFKKRNLLNPIKSVEKQKEPATDSPDSTDDLLGQTKRNLLNLIKSVEKSR